MSIPDVEQRSCKIHLSFMPALMKLRLDQKQQRLPNFEVLDHQLLMLILGLDRRSYKTLLTCAVSKVQLLPLTQCTVNYRAKTARRVHQAG